VPSDHGGSDQGLGVVKVQLKNMALEADVPNVKVRQLRHIFIVFHTIITLFRPTFDRHVAFIRRGH
jgi:hypothetical protein